MSEQDAELVRRSLEGDREGMAGLYDRYAPLIRTMCFDCVREWNGADDLAQEVFLRACRQLHSLDDATKFRAWLISIARRVCQEWLRQRARSVRASRDQRWTNRNGVHSSAADVESGHAHADLRDAIAALPDDLREVLHVFYLHAADAQVASEVLGVSRSTLYRMVAEARVRLRSMLTRKEIVR